MSERQPPHNLEAERSVLGAVLVAPDALDEALAIVGPDDFYLPAHREIWEVMVLLSRRGEPVDVVALADELRKRGQLPKLEGGEGYLVTLAQAVPTAANVEHYARRVHEKAILRRLILLCGETQARAYSDYGEIGPFLDSFEAASLALSQRRNERGPQSASALMPAFLDELERRAANKRDVTGVATGIHRLDRLTTGFNAGELVVVAARPGVGKTSWAVNIAARAAIDQQLPVYFISREMKQLEIIQKLVSSEGRINYHHLRTGNLERKDFSTIYTIQASLGGRLVVDDSALTLHEVASRVRRFRADRQLFPIEEAEAPRGLVIVDYLQLIKAPATANNRRASREEEIDEVGRELKLLAQRLALPVLALAQLNRATEKEDRRPILSDLRGSGSIEAHADTVIAIHNPSMHPSSEANVERGRAELLVLKQRHGAHGVIFASWRGEIGRFDPYVEDRPEWSGAPDPRLPDD